MTDNGVNIDDDDEKLAFEILNNLEYVQERESVSLTRLFDSFFEAFTGEAPKQMKVDVDSNYFGLKLGENFEEGDFKAMFHDFKNKRTLHAKYAIKIFDESIRLLSKQPNIREVTLEENDTLVVVGDLHGHFDDLSAIISRFNIPGKTNYFIFNGDWVDRGEYQIEVLLTIFYSFILYPDRVILNRGNHEDYMQNSHSNYRPCLRAIVDRYFDKYGYVVYQKLDELFRCVPLASIINNPKQNQRMFVVHGGINDHIDLNEIQKLNRTVYDSICKPNLPKGSLEETYLSHVQDLLWSDPYPINQTIYEDCTFNTCRNIGKHFSANVTKKFLDKNGFTALIRSHECKANGYEVLHSGKLITVFSASNYNQKNLGCILKICGNKPKFDVLTYQSKGQMPGASALNLEDNLIRAIKQLKTYIFRLKPVLMDDFKILDTKDTGIITIDELIRTLNKHLPNIPYYEVKDRICECDDNTNKAKYKTLFAFMTMNSKYSDAPECIVHNHETLQCIFEKIDKDNSGSITPQEFKEACSFAFEKLGVKFTQNEINHFIDEMDYNKDGLIDLQEFKNAFTISFIDN
jgi:serine/threonine-protein phosphatase with EF-hands